MFASLPIVCIQKTAVVAPAATGTSTDAAPTVRLSADTRKTSGSRDVIVTLRAVGAGVPSCTKYRFWSPPTGDSAKSENESAPTVVAVNVKPTELCTLPNSSGAADMVKIAPPATPVRAARRLAGVPRN